MPNANQSLPPSGSHSEGPVQDRLIPRPRRERADAAAGLLDRIAWRAACGLDWILDRLRRSRTDDTLRGPIEIGPSGIPSIILHFARLAAEDRFYRFNSRMSLAALVGRYTAPEARRSRFLGYLCGGRIVALAELSTGGSSFGEETELGISVLAPWQQRGLGEALLRDAIGRVCHESGRDLVLYVAADNRRMLRLVRRLGGERAADGENGKHVFAARPRPPQEPGEGADRQDGDRSDGER